MGVIAAEEVSSQLPKSQCKMSLNLLNLSYKKLYKRSVTSWGIQDIKTKKIFTSELAELDTALKTKLLFSSVFILRYLHF